MASHNQRPIGEELVSQGFVSAKKLEQALGEQDRKIGQILLDNHDVSEDQIARALASQQGLPYIDLKRYKVSFETVCILDEMQSRKFRAAVLEDRKSPTSWLCLTPIICRRKMRCRRICTGRSTLRWWPVTNSMC